jgi:hypothetical protein
VSFVRKGPLGVRLALVVALAAFLYFAHYRVEFVGGCDSAAYLAESFRLRGVDVGLAPDPSLGFPNAFVPICMVRHGGVVHSLFPPGFPSLLAGAGVFGLEYFVTPFFGALGGLALFFLARRRTTDAIALGTMIAWYAAPMTFWGATQIMSDYVAACLVLLCVLALEHARPLLAGLVLGFALGVRPTSILVVPALLVTLGLGSRPRREWLAWGGVVLTAVAWALFVRFSFGSFDLPYAGNLDEMHGENFVRQLLFLSKETTRQHAPILALAIVGAVRSPRACLPLVAWFAPFLVVHSLWRMPYEWFWHLRFLASALPALFLACAIGAKAISDAIAQTRLRMRRALGALAAIVLAVYAVWWTRVPEIRVHRAHDFDERYARDTRRVLELVPRNAIIGAREHAIALRFYGHLQTFDWCHPDAPALEKAALARGRAVYAIFMLADENGCPGSRAGLDVEEIAILPSSSRLVRLKP